MFPRESVTQIKSVEDFGKVGSALKGMTGEHAEAMKQMKAAVLFTEKKSTSSLLLSLAYSMMPRLIVAMVNSELDEVTSHFGVEDFPSFVMVDPVTAPETGEILDTFSGDIKDRDAILAWMEEFALDIKVGEPEADPAADTQSEGQVMTLTEIEFPGVVLGGPEAWVVAYLEDAEEALEEVIPAWEKASDMLVGQIRGGVVYCDASPALCQDLEDIPLIKVFPHDMELLGNKEERSRPFGVDKKGLTRAIDAASSSVPLRVLNPAMMGGADPNQILQQMAPVAIQQNKGLVIVFGKRKEPPVFLQSLGIEFEEAYLLIYVTDDNEEMMKQMGVKEAPGLAVLHGSTPDGAQPGESVEVAMQVATYRSEVYGSMRYASVGGFLVSLLNQFNPQLAHNISSKKKGAGGAGGAGGEGQATSRRKQLMQVTKDNWPESCPPGLANLCVIAFVDGGLGEEAVEEALGPIRQVLAKESQDSSSPFVFSWVDATCDPDFSASLDVDLAMLPAVVLYSPKKQRSARHVGTYEYDSVKTFLQQVLRGSTHTYELYQEPVPSDVDCSDGNRPISQDIPVEEDEDMDDLMAEILAEEQREREMREQELREEEEARKLAEEEAAAAEKKSKKKKKKKKKSKKSEEL